MTSNLGGPSINRIALLGSLHRFESTIQTWLGDTSAVEFANVEFEDEDEDGEEERIRGRCTASWDRTRDAYFQLSLVATEEMLIQAERAYHEVLHYADRVFDGLLPSGHADAERFDQFAFEASMGELRKNVAAATGLTEDDPRLDSSIGSRTRLGGTGARY
ncbi:hypothetical protein ABH926_010098 [Catenulispora sp. GP43]|uniref:hypothetical protein n=1 Tax=Catenulispora sp. GP43 TaxID=3156263 RepID=UPI00351931F9